MKCCAESGFRPIDSEYHEDNMMKDNDRFMIIIRLARTFSCSMFLLFSLVAEGQTGVTVAGFGYRTPSNSVSGAPGQVMTVSVFGVLTRLPDPVFPVAGNGLPTNVQGLSVTFVQGTISIPLPIRGVQQSSCPATGVCSPATTFTIQIPYELSLDSDAGATLEVRDGATVVAHVAVKPVTDAIHVINTCDQTGVYLSIAFGLPAGSCVPMVMHPGGPLVTASAPAKPGEILVMWAYGLGAIDHPIPTDCCSSPDQLPLATQPFNVGFSYPDANRATFRRLAQTIPTYAGMVGEGLYQVHFFVPAVPSVLPACTELQGNLRVLVSGPNSADGADLCVEP